MSRDVSEVVGTMSGVRGWRSLMLVALIATLLPTAVSAGAGRDARRTTGGVVYRLVDDFSDAPWQLTPGRFRRVRDVSSAPDGTVFVLDDGHDAVHVLSQDGRPLRVIRLPAPPPGFDQGSGYRSRGLDVGFDGTLHVLRTAPAGAYEPTTGSWIDVLNPDGRRLAGFALPRGYTDIAAGPDGRIYLSRNGPQIVPTPEPRQPPPRLPGGVDVFDRSGTALEVIEHPAIFYAMAVDVAASGILYIVNRVASPWDYDHPGPQPTPLPALVSGATDQLHPAGAGVDQSGDELPIEGVVIFDSLHEYRETVPFTTPEEVAVGRAGVFISRNVEVFALGSSEPLYSGPPGQVVVGFYDSIILHLDVPRDGRLLAAMNHCYFQGLVAFDVPWATRVVPRYIGSLDAPRLEGPVSPLRIAVGDELALLQDRFAALGAPPDERHFALRQATEPQSVQHWSTSGWLRAQMGICAGSMSSWLPDESSAYTVKDVAADGPVVYTVEAGLLRQRPDDMFPGWTFWPGELLGPDDEVHLRAVSADKRHVVALDAGSGRVHVLAPDGAVEQSWPLPVEAVPSDLAVSGDVVFLADRSTATVHRVSLDGRYLGDWPVHIAPYRIDTGADGSVFVLDPGGWAAAYDGQGRFISAWHMPQVDAEAMDIAAGEDARVYVAYRKFATNSGSGAGASELVGAGVWVFAPATAPERNAPPVGSCVVSVDKTARPKLVRLGDEVEVRLTVDGLCPGQYDRVQVVLLIDTSRSMNWDDALDQSKELAAVLLESLDPRAAEVALVTFDDGGQLLESLTSDLASVAAAVSALGAWGDSHMAQGLVLAQRELTGPRSDPDARRVVVVLTDGEYTDDATTAARALRDTGAEIYALALPHGGLASFFTNLTAVTGSADHVIVEPGADDVRSLALAVVAYRPAEGLFRLLDVEDVVPANMRLVPGSVQPAADIESGVLHWRLGAVAAGERVSLGYRLQPLEVGDWPTNVTAAAYFADSLGNDGVAPFPQPWVRVWDESLLTEKVYMPLGARRSCLRRGRALDVVLVMDASRSMDEATTDGRTKLQAARQAAELFARLLRRDDDRVAVVSFHDQAAVLQGLTPDVSLVEAALGRIRTMPGTRLDAGLSAARQLIAASGRSEAQAVVVLLTDGLQTGDAAPAIAEARTLRSDGTLVFTIGLGPDADGDLLSSLCTTEEDYLPSPTAADLERAYRKVLDSIACRVP